MENTVNTIKGRILKGVGGLYSVRAVINDDICTVACRARGVFRHQHIEPLAGDCVTLVYDERSSDTADGGAYVIDGIDERKNSLIRPPLANLDYIFVSMAAASPTPVLTTVDKLIAIAEHNGIEPVIVITKRELAPEYADELEAIFQKGRAGGEFTQHELDAYRTALLRTMAKEYARRGWAMELHMGPMRNNNTLMFNKIGPDTGFDSIDDKEIAQPLSRFLDSLAKEELLPRTILFTLNPKDNYVLGTMLGNFQNSDAPGKIQFGSGWWFNDNLDGMREQMKAFGNLSVLGKFVGMVTDSRSFLSYPRHEYFRRILCGLLGDMVEDGLYPDDMETLKQLVQDISYNNAAKYFGLE